MRRVGELNAVARPGGGSLVPRRSTSPSDTPNHDRRDASARRLEVEGLVAETTLELNDEAAAVLARIIHAHLDRQRQRRKGAA